MPEEEAAYGKPAQRLMTGFIADADPSWHLEILLIRFDDTKWLAVTKEGNAELLDMSKQRAVKLAWVPGLDGRGRGGSTSGSWPASEGSLGGSRSKPSYARHASWPT